MKTFAKTRRIGCLAAALALLGVVLCLPSGGQYPFSARMAGHLVLQLIIPALFLLSLPDVRIGPKFLNRPVLTWFLGLAGMWAWHSPALCNAAVRSPWLDACQLFSLFLFGAAFWWPVFGPDAGHRLQPGFAVLYLFTACLGCTVLGIVIAFAPAGLYAAASLPGVLNGWQFASPDDQRMGGLLMWVPGCLIYATAIMMMMGRWFGAPQTSSISNTKERNA